MSLEDALKKIEADYGRALITEEEALDAFFWVTDMVLIGHVNFNFREMRR